MAYNVSKVDVWQAEIDDRVGGLNEKLGPLAEIGVDLTFIVARRQPHIPGKGIVYLGGIAGKKATNAAMAAGLTKANDIFALRVEGTNKPGDAHRVLQYLSAAGVSLRGVTASVIGRKYVLVLGFDSANDADKAAKAIRAA